MNGSAPIEGMTVSRSSIIRVTVQTQRPYQEVIAAFESEVGRWDAEVAAKLVAEKAKWEVVREAVCKMAGHQGLMIFAKINQGEIASLSGILRQSVVFLVGNAVIATDILKIDIRAGMLVPFRVEVYDDGSGGALSYDLPSSFLASLGKPGLEAIGQSLDEKIESVVRSLSTAAC
jgi:uncharacterized protein (DUF302 family)